MIERDTLPPIGEHRRGVPHGRHLHGLHPRGREILDDLFPGFTASLTASDAVRCDVLGGARWQLSGHQLRQADIGLPGLLASRPFLEGHVRAMVQKLPGVRFLEDCSVDGLTVTADKRTVTGVQVRGPRGGPPAQVAARLVVDATGRGSRTPVWLGELGYERPAQERVEIGLGYATRTYRLRPGAMNRDQMILTAATPASRAAGCCRHRGRPPHADHRRHLRRLPAHRPAGLRRLRGRAAIGRHRRGHRRADPLDDPVPFRFPASVRHRYERLTGFPGGLLVIGDAVCSFNPIYGQGMTVAAAEAMTLRGRWPARGARAAATSAPSPPRSMSPGTLLSAPTWRSPGTRQTLSEGAPGQRVHARLHAAAAHDQALAASLVRVIGLKDRPEGLLRPDRVLRVLCANLAGIRRPAPPLADQAPATLAGRGCNQRPNSQRAASHMPGSSQPGAGTLKFTEEEHTS